MPPSSTYQQQPHLPVSTAYQQPRLPYATAHMQGTGIQVCNTPAQNYARLLGPLETRGVRIT